MIFFINIKKNVNQKSREACRNFHWPWLTLCVWQLQQGLTYFTNEGQSLAVAGIGADCDGTRLVQ